MMEGDASWLIGAERYFKVRPYYHSVSQFRNNRFMLNQIYTYDVCSKYLLFLFFNTYHFS